MKKFQKDESPKWVGPSDVAELNQSSVVPNRGDGVEKNEYRLVEALEQSVCSRILC